jgi:PRC-barrel domain
VAAEPTPQPLSAAEVAAWTGYDVDEIDGARVGRVEGLYADAASGEPTWLVVAMGKRRPKRIAVPARDCAAAAGRVWIAHGREALRAAPAVDRARPLLREHERTICAHYGIEPAAGRHAAVAQGRRDEITSLPVAP